MLIERTSSFFSGGGKPTLPPNSGAQAPPKDGAAKEKTSRFGIKGKGLFKGKGKASPEKQKQKEAPPTASGNAVDL